MLRPFRDADLVEVRRLISRTIDTSYPPTYPPRAVDFFGRVHADDAILERAKGGHLVVVEDAGTIVATGAIVAGEVTGVFVAPERQGDGLGGIVMDELEAHASRNGQRSVSLSVSLPSRGFYRRRGYRIVEARSIDVVERSRRVAMRKPLSRLTSAST
jgi:ribosomal protein S18 acetylase RimI-like enzyme